MGFLLLVAVILLFCLINKLAVVSETQGKLLDNQIELLATLEEFKPFTAATFEMTRRLSENAGVFEEVDTNNIDASKLN